MAQPLERATRFYVLTSNDDWMEFIEDDNDRWGSEVAVFAVDNATEDDLVEAAESRDGPGGHGRLLGRLILREGRPVIVDEPPLGS
jgi:hypothetical protein